MKTKDAASLRFERLRILSDGDAAQLRKLAFQLTSRPSRVAANAYCRALGFVRRKTNAYALPETHIVRRVP